MAELTTETTETVEATVTEETTTETTETVATEETTVVEDTTTEATTDEVEDTTTDETSETESEETEASEDTTSEEVTDTEESEDIDTDTDTDSGTESEDESTEDDSTTEDSTEDTDIPQCPPTAESKPMEEDPEVFRGVRKSQILEHADFILKCGCGHVKTIASDVTGGVNYVIPATGNHSLDLECEACGAKLTLTFVPHVEASIEEPVANTTETETTTETTDDEQVLQESQSSEQI